MLDKIYKLHNPIQYYAWGSKTAIPQLLGIPNPEEKPMAELWMGAHPKAPSKVLVDGRWHSLLDIISRYPKPVLGEEVAKKFNNELPFLFKILAAEKPLSIQVHPNKEQAKEGFEREDVQGIPIDSPHRNYKDQNHKPELLCALTPFEAMKGFRPVEEIISTFKGLKGDLFPVLLEKLMSPGLGLREFFGLLMKLDETKKERILTSVLQYAEKHKREDRACYWVLTLNKYFPGDIGIISPLILNVLSLKPGEAIYLPARELHAYLKGTGLEIMANSDNVLRGGLTSKHMDVEELLKIVHFEGYKPTLVTPRKVGNCCQVYETTAEEFQLSRISINKEVSFEQNMPTGAEIIICLKGFAEIFGRRASEGLKIIKGESIIIPAASVPYKIIGDALMYKASVPV